LNEQVAKFFFDVPPWQPEIIGLRKKTLKVDLAIMFQADRRAVLIENKTMGAGPDSLDDYYRLVDYLNDKGLNATLYVLISHGNPTDPILKSVLSNKGLIILWEDVFRLMDQTPFFKNLFDVNLADYCNFADP